MAVIKKLNNLDILDAKSVHGVALDSSNSHKLVVTSSDDSTTTTLDMSYAEATISTDAKTGTSGLFTGDEKRKLDEITAGAEVNQNAFSNVKVGDTTLAAAAKTDTVDFAGDSVVTVTATAATTGDNATNAKVTFAHATSGVTAGTYTSVTVNANGHVTAGTSPTTISGYGITDATIEDAKTDNTANGDKIITLGSDTATVLTHDSKINASMITTGTIDIDRLPAGALERCVVVADDTARFALTTDSVQLGDTVKVTSTGLMYFVKDDTKLDSADGYVEYTAGAATSVAWSGVTSKPNLAGAATMEGAANAAVKLVSLGQGDAADSDVAIGSGTQPVYFASGIPVATTYSLAHDVPSTAVFDDAKEESGTYTHGYLSATDKQKLDGIAEGANNYTLPTASSSVLGGVKVGSNLAISDGVLSGNYSVATASSNGTGGAAGLISATDQEKLNGIAEGANNYTLPTATSSTLGGIKVGDNLSISSSVLSAKTFSGATASAAGTAGYVPAVAATKTDYVLRSNGKWTLLGITLTQDTDGSNNALDGCYTLGITVTDLA